MRRTIVLITIASAVIWIAACRRQATIASPNSSTGEAGQSQNAGPQGEELMTIRGTLKPTVERGGWILATESEEYLLLNISKFRDQVWFLEGARLEARGKPDPEVITTFMQGTPFVVSELKPVEEDGDPGVAAGEGVTR